MSPDRSLVIGIDARSAGGQPTGVGRYVRNLIAHMAPLDPSIRFRVYTAVPGVAHASAAPGAPGAAPPNVEEVVLRAPLGGRCRSLDNAVVWNHLRLPLHLLRRRVDLLHGTFYTLPALCPCPAVVTIHDITFDLHPEWFTRKARLAFSGFAAASARKARHVLTVSECSRRDIVSRYGVPESRVTAVPLAPDPSFASAVDPDELARVRARHRLGEEYLLHVGSITPRRNIDRLLDAFAAVRQRAPHLTLVLAGRVEPPSGPIEPLVAGKGLADAVRVIGYVEQEDLPALYRGAVAVVYPSLYEGFGLPVVEAMACGVPVLASTTSCFPEVASDAALLVDPADPRALEEGLRCILTDTALRARLVQRGLARAASFTWDKTARETLAVYRRALDPGSEARAA